MFTKLKRNQQIRRTFYSYLLAFTALSLCIIIAISLLSYKATANAIKEEIVAKQSLNLHNKNQNMTNATNDIIQTAYAIGLNNAVLLYAKNQDNLYLRNDVISLIEQLDITDSNIMAIEIAFTSSMDILTSDGAGQIINETLTSNWLMSANNSHTKQTFTKPSTYYNEEYEVIPVVTYIQQLPVGSQKNLGYIAIHTKEAYLSSLLNNTSNITGPSQKPLTSIFLIDEEGTILSSSDKTQLGTDYLYPNKYLIQDSTLHEGFIQTNSRYDRKIINFIKMGHIPFTIISETSNSAITARTRPLLTNMILIAISALLGSILLSYILTLRLYSPIKRLMNKTTQYPIKSPSQDTFNQKQNNTSKNELTYITTVIDSIQKDTYNLKQQLYAQEPLLIDRFLKNIILRQHSTNNDINSKLKELNLNFPFTSYAILDIELADYNAISNSSSHLNMDTLMFAIKNIVTELISIDNAGICSESSQGHVLCLLNYDQASHTTISIEALLTNIQETLLELLHIKTTIAIGSTYNSITNAYLSYEEAQDIIQYKMIFSESILLYDAYNNLDHEDYYYPIKLMLALNDATKAGHKTLIISNIKQIFNALESKEQLSYDNTYKILIQLVDLLLQSINELGYNPSEIWPRNHKLYNQISRLHSLEDIQAHFTQLYEDVADYVLEHSVCENEHILNIKSYINNHSHEDIYLSIIADEVKLNISYMSRIFKQATNMTIFEYITSTRINASETLLKCTSKTVKEIALSVGYNNTQSYIKYFKTINGTTPGKYRKSFQ